MNETDSNEDEAAGWRNTTIDEQRMGSDNRYGHAAHEITQLRKSVDDVDAAIIALLAKRFTYTARIGNIKAQAGFSPEDHQREEHQDEQLHRLALSAGLEPQIAHQYLEFVVTAAKQRHTLIADSVSRGSSAEPLEEPSIC
jgi:chorismate mutase